MAADQDRDVREAMGDITVEDSGLSVSVPSELVLNGTNGEGNIPLFPDRTYTVDEVLATAEKLYAFVLKTEK